MVRPLLFCAVLFGAAPLAAAERAPFVAGWFASEGVHATDFAASGEVGVLVTHRHNAANLFVLDLHDRARPVRIATIGVDANLNAVAFDGHFAYVAASDNQRELLVVDLGDPLQPQIVGFFDVPSAKDAVSIALRDGVLFLGMRGTASFAGHELWAFDVSRPEAPRLLDSLEIGGSVFGLALDGDVLYAATSHYAKELIAFDVSDPAKITEIAAVDLPGSAAARAVAFDRRALYVARRSRRASLAVIDKRGFALLAELALGSRLEDVRVYRDRLYAAAAGLAGGLRIFDVSDAAKPRLLHDLRTDGTVRHLRIQPPFTYLSTSGAQRDLVVVNTASLLRPNVVIVYTDDQHWSTVDFMPHVQDLAARGMVFEQSFVTTPLCGPSRSSLLTGLYAHNHGAWINFDYIGRRGGIGSDTSTIATWLRAAGYRTGFFGKYVNAFQQRCNTGRCVIPPGWDEWQAIEQGHYFNYTINDNGAREFFAGEPADYSTDVLARKALDFIAAEDGRPFFAVLSTNAPHSDATGIDVIPAPRHTGAFSGVAPWRPPNYDEEDVSDKPPSIFATLPRADDVITESITWRFVGDYIYQRQLEALQAVDEALAAIVERLQSLGMEEDTLVIFSSDNGYNLGEHRLWVGKSFPHEQSIRVPFVAAYPRLIVAGRTDPTSLVLNIDVAPTIADLANVAPTSPVDGASLVPLFRNDPSAEWRADFLIENYGSFNFSGQAVYLATRSRLVKYAHWVGTGEDELYDLAVDPDELENQACNPGYSSHRRFARARIDSLLTNPTLRVDFGSGPACAGE